MTSRAFSGMFRSTTKRPSALGQSENFVFLFFRRADCKCSLALRRSYATSIVSSNRKLWKDSNRGDSVALNNSILSNYPWTARRLKSGKAQQKPKEERELETRQPILGDEPPLYDGKPAWWARWIFVLLAFDVLFVGFSVDMVMRNWTQLLETPSKPESPSDASSSTSSTKTYELRPLWQRLSLASFEIFVGAAAGALILASRDRTVWRLRIRRIPISALPSGHIGTKSASSHTVDVVSLETGSGRTRRFLMRECVLSPGRDLSELFLSIPGVRGRFILSMNGARILGATPNTIGESTILRELLTSKGYAADVALINSTIGGVDPENAHLAELRKGLAKAWIKLGGDLHVPKGSQRTDGWTSGPVAERAG